MANQYLSVHLSGEEWAELVRKVRFRPQTNVLDNGTGTYQIIRLEFAGIQIALFSPTVAVER